MTLSTFGLLFRNTDAYVVNPANHYWSGAVGGSYNKTQGYGFPGSVGFSANESTAVPAIAGYMNLNTKNVSIRIDCDRGKHRFRLGLGRTATAAKSLVVFDGSSGDNISSMNSGNYFTYVVGGNPQTGQFTLIPANGQIALYRCTKGGKAAVVGTGTTDNPQTPAVVVSSQAPPTHTSGTANDGPDITWQYIKTSVYYLERPSAAGIMDAAGNTFTGNPAAYTAWDSGNAEGPIVESKEGFFTVLNGLDNGGVIRYFGLTASPTDLKASYLTNKDRKDMGTSPVFYADQPQGKFLARVNVNVGTELASNYSVGGTFTSPTRGGTASSYFQLVNDPKNRELWLVASSNRIPSDATGTLTISQNDPVNTLSPFVTSFTPVILNSQNRPTDTSVLGLISTEAWVERKLIRDKVLGSYSWQGYTGQSFYANGDATASSPAALKTLLDNFNAQAAPGRWFRIRVQNGDWSGAMVWNFYDFLKDGTGGLLIEPDTGHDPYLVGSWLNTNGTLLRGVEMRGLNWHPTLGAAAGDTCFDIRNPLNHASNTAKLLNVVVFRNCSFVSQNWVRNATFNSIGPIRGAGMEVLRVINCYFYGLSNAIDANECHIFQSTGNRFEQFNADNHGTGGSGLIRESNIADKAYYTIIEGNTVCNPNSFLPAGTIVKTVPHVDFNQERTMAGYADGGNTGNSGAAFVARLGQYLTWNGNYYKCVQSGTTIANNAPTHTSGDATDGSAIWRWISSSTDAPRNHKLYENNIVENSGTAYQDSALASDKARFYPASQITIHSTGMPSNVIMINNFWLSAITRGVLVEQLTTDALFCIEYNTFSMPTMLPPDPRNGPQDVKFTDGAYANIPSFSLGDINLLDKIPRMIARHNIIGNVSDDAVIDEYNKVIRISSSATDAQRPDLVLRGPYNSTPNSDGFRMPVNPPVNDGSLSGEVIRSNISKITHPKAGRTGARATELYPIKVRVRDSAGNLSDPISIMVKVKP